jgi:hypothetical protein
MQFEKQLSGGRSPFALDGQCKVGQRPRKLRRADFGFGRPRAVAAEGLSADHVGKFLDWLESPR